MISFALFSLILLLYALLCLQEVIGARWCKMISYHFSAYSLLHIRRFQCANIYLDECIGYKYNNHKGKKDGGGVGDKNKCRNERRDCKHPVHQKDGDIGIYHIHVFGKSTH